MLNKTILILLLIFILPINSQDITQPVESVAKHWFEYLKAYDLKNIKRMRFLVYSYPNWSLEYADRLLTGYLSFSIKNEKEAKEKHVKVIESIGKIYKQIFGSDLLLNRLKLYKNWSNKEKKIALKGIITYAQARASRDALYLFSSDLKLAEDLNKSKISEKLKKEFKTAKKELTQKAFVEAKRNNVEWLINDKGKKPIKKYLLVNRQGKIRVFNIQLYREAIELFEKVKDYYSLGALYVNVAKLRYAWSKIEDAKEFLKKSLIYYQKTKDNLNIAKANNSLGLMYYSLQKYKKAKKYYEKALKLAREKEFRKVEASALNNLGALKKQLKKYKESKKLFKESLDLYRKLQIRGGRATALSNIGTIEQLEGNNEEAKKYLEKSLVLTKGLDDQSGVLHTLKLLSSASEALGEHKKAREYLEDALEIAKKLKDRTSAKEILSKLAKIAESEKDLADAKKYYKEMSENALIIGDKEAAKQARKNLGELEDDTFLYIIIALSGILIIAILV